MGIYVQILCMSFVWELLSWKSEKSIGILLSEVCMNPDGAYLNVFFVYKKIWLLCHNGIINSLILSKQVDSKINQNLFV